MARQPHFIGSKSRILALQQHCLLIEEEEDPEGMYRQYLHTPTGTMWHYYSPPPDGFPKCAMIMVRDSIDLDDVRTCILDARYTYEIAIACAYISWKHYESIVVHLEQIVKTSESLRQLKNVARTVVWSSIDNPFNHFGSQGKTMMQIEKDYEYFKDLAARATHVQNLAEERVGIRSHRRIGWK